MATDTMNNYDIFLEDLAEGVHDMDTDTFTIALSNTLPVAGDALLAGDAAEISYTNLPNEAGRALTLSSSDNTSGVYQVTFADKVITATGTAATFQYVIVYNSSTVGKTDPLVGWLDYGSGLTLENGESLTVDFSGSLFTIT